MGIALVCGSRTPAHMPCQMLCPWCHFPNTCHPAGPSAVLIGRPASFEVPKGGNRPIVQPMSAHVIYSWYVMISLGAEQTYRRVED